MVTRISAALLVCLLLLVFFASCGGNGDGASETASATAHENQASDTAISSDVESFVHESDKGTQETEGDGTVRLPKDEF